MKNSNCGSCPHLHRCRATNNDECIDTIIGRKHYMSNREKQIRADAIDSCKTVVMETIDNELLVDTLLMRMDKLNENDS